MANMEELARFKRFAEQRLTESFGSLSAMLVEPIVPDRFVQPVAWIVDITDPVYRTPAGTFIITPRAVGVQYCIQ